jgi:ribosomal protein L11 methylase PrmA
MLGVSDLQGKRFLDIGCGSGLFSLAARRLGAAVHSFDYDPKSAGCTQELKRRYFAGDSLEEGSVLDRDYLGRLLECHTFWLCWGRAS